MEKRKSENAFNSGRQGGRMKRREEQYLIKGKVLETTASSEQDQKTSLNN